ncbi:potassium transporter Kup [bacterium]|nr:potassium transporter Kup [bacterium]
MSVVPEAIPGQVSPAPRAPDPTPALTHSASFEKADSSNFSTYQRALALGALGVVYGDIGTSPLYAVREALHSGHVEVNAANIMGVLSLIFWSLILVVCLKYLLLVMRADHHGEGGILALTALVSESSLRQAKQFGLLLTCGLFGTALLYGDGIITPAISVLSAVEGLEYITPLFKPYIVTLTLAILVGLFAFQYKGTESVGKLFGPIMLFWFLCLGALGLYQMVQQPAVLQALNPYYSLWFLWHNGGAGVMVLGSVFLVVTGGEALYADMGHFGRQPIQLAWFFVAFPALMLNYLGQGALMLRDPAAVKDPFFLMAPGWALSSVVVLATVATIIASQALISAVFSLTVQAIQLGYLPRMQILYTSDTEKGQIYVPTVNWLLMVACLSLVVSFKSSSNLAAAYGIAVTATMLITTLLFWMFLIHVWRWPSWRAGLVCGFFLVIEITFFSANIVKVFKGGWFPLVVGAGVYLLMSTWKSGRALLFQMLQRRTVPLTGLLQRLHDEDIHRHPGVGVFMYGNPEGTPPALLANLSHNHTLHEKVVILSVEISTAAPRVLDSERVTLQSLRQGFYRVQVRFGYREKPDVLPPLRQLILDGETFRPEQASFFVGRETVIPRRGGPVDMPYWQEVLFATMTRNALDATSFFGIPPDCVVELGTQLEI